MRIITEDQVRDVLIRLIDEPGSDRTSTRRQYTDIDGQYCVAGAVLNDLNIPLPGVDTVWNIRAVSALNRQYLPLHDTELSERALALLTVAQVHFDSGFSLAESAQVALDRYPA